MVDGEHYQANYNEITKKAMLKIKDVDIEKMGTYTLWASNGYQNQTKQFTLNVTGNEMYTITDL